METIHTIGRRKRATARVFLKEGSGKITVNGNDLEEFFHRPAYHIAVRTPFRIVARLDRYDVVATVKGGGTTGQSGALQLGIARALVEVDAELRAALKKAGMLTRDAREVERKKPGRPGARKRFQFSKR